MKNSFYKMRKIKSLIVLLFLGTSGAMAQSAAVQKVAKSVFTLTTFNKEGNIKGTCQGVFINEDGTAISAFQPFVGADSAVIVDATGRSHKVDYIMGADENYDVVKFKVKMNGIKSSPLSSKESTEGSQAWIVPYSVTSPNYQKLTVNKVEKFNTKYNYYIFDFNASDNLYASPIVNANGQVLGLVKSLGNTSISATDANYIESLQLDALSIQKLQQTGIRIGLPDKENEAVTTMLLARGRRSLQDNFDYANEFINKFPKSAEGYKSLAELYCGQNKFAEADQALRDGISRASAKDEAHSNYAAQMYQKLVYSNDSTYSNWTFDKALNEANEAFRIKPEAAYKHQQAQIIFSKGDYHKALTIFQDLTKSKMNNGEIWYEMAQCKMNLKAPDNEVIELLDSAVIIGSRLGNASPYYYARGMWYDAHDEYRKAIRDYNTYDSLTATINPVFFYTRYKAEANAKMWQQALIDIAHASVLDSTEPTYLAEWASLDLRVKRNEEAEKVAERCTKVAPNYPDGWLLLGLSQIELKKKTSGLENLEKAKALGDDRAQKYIEKYK